MSQLLLLKMKTKLNLVKARCKNKSAVRSDHYVVKHSDTIVKKVDFKKENDCQVVTLRSWPIAGSVRGDTKKPSHSIGRYQTT